ncbi:MAG: SBBP repeat-containing protein [Bacteroidia bacterium]
MKNIKTIALIITLNVIATMQLIAQNNTFGWAKRTGAQFDDSGNSIVTDAAGNIYTTGYFEGSVDFDPGSGTFNLNFNGLGDVFIQKLDAAGNFGWAKQMGGTGFDRGYSIAIDGAGNIITTGSFENTVDFDPSAVGSFNLTATDSLDIFIQKLDPNGNFLWAKRMGGTGDEEGKSVAIDVNDNIIVTGYFSSVTDFDPGTPVFNLTSNGLFDNFIIKLDASGNFKWVTQTGNSNYDNSKAVTADLSGNIYSTGAFNGTVDFDPGLNSYPLTSNGGSLYGDIFIQKLDTGGNFIWAKQMGWFGDDIGTSIKTDAAGNVYATGWFQNTVDFNPGTGALDTFNLITTGTAAGNPYSDDIFILKLDAGGNFIWAKNMGGDNDDRGNSLAIDNTGKILATGYHSGLGDFNPGTGTSNLTGDGTFLEKLDNAGNFIWAKEVGTAGEGGHCITSDANGNLYTTGHFDHTVDFNPDPGPPFNLVSNAGSIDFYVLKLNSASAGIDENILDNTGNIFPNPNKGQFNIDLGKTYSDLNIEIKNIADEVVYASTISETNHLSLNIKQPAGFYFVTVSNDASQRTFKLILN